MLMRWYARTSTLFLQDTAWYLWPLLGFIVRLKYLKIFYRFLSGSSKESPRTWLHPSSPQLDLQFHSGRRWEASADYYSSSTMLHSWGGVDLVLDCAGIRSGKLFFGFISYRPDVCNIFHISVWFAFKVIAIQFIYLFIYYKVVHQLIPVYSYF